MANITSRNIIRRNVDSLETQVTGTVVSKESAALDFTGASAVTKLKVETEIPQDTGIYFAFSSGGSWFTLNTEGYAQEFSTSIPDAEALISNGNTPSELNALTSVPAFAGKKIRIAIALSMPDEFSAKPELKSFTAEYKVLEDQAEKTVMSQVYRFGGDKLILSCKADSSSEGSASVSAEGNARLSDGTMTGWIPADELAGLTASQVQFRGVLKSPNYTDKAYFGGIAFEYAGMTIAGGSGASRELYTKTEDWYMDLRQIRMMVRHDDLNGSSLKAFIALRKEPESREGYELGTGTGEWKEYTLPDSGNIDVAGIRLYFDGARIYTGFEANASTGKIFCNAPEGTVITIDYDYDYEPEEWHEMALSGRWEYPEYTQSEYTYQRTDDEAVRQVCSLKLVLSSSEGRSENEFLGTGTGYLAGYNLSHAVKDRDITVKAGDTELSSESWNLSQDGRTLNVSASEGAQITASYSWITDSPVIRRYTAVFSE